MTGPEHYQEAERLADLAISPAGVAMKADGMDVAVVAQVHATLALTAALAPGRVVAFEDLPNDRLLDGWIRALS